ncbi:uncharacterized protein VTP21DRAFT_11031 [Calcarisporiella thermophila]|uniref:uncharacterized protein n=1 Tax=Calcarisporiella thermophila TaxID=911321 RepID=UPI003743F108
MSDRYRSSKREHDSDSDKEQRHRSSRKEKKHKSHRHHKSDNSETDEEVKNARKLIKPLTEENYFDKSSEFRVWLVEEKGKHFNDLSSEDTRKYFKKFVRAWNKYKLDKKYYVGISSTQLPVSATTSYKWKFAKNINQDELDQIRDSVDTMTNSSKVKLGDAKLREKDISLSSKPVIGPSLPAGNIGPHRPYDSDEEEERRAQERARKKKDFKEMKELYDELIDKPTGREAMIEKKRARNAYYKQFREKDVDVELDDRELMGGGDDFQSALAAKRRAEQARQGRRERFKDEKVQSMSEKLSNFQAKEAATMEMFKRMAEERKRREQGGG